jgi:hypothetical protein
VVNTTATAQSFVWSPYYSTIVVTNPSTTLGLFLRSDGNTSVALSGTYAGWQHVQPNTTAVITNQLPLPNANSTNNLGLLNDPLHATQVQVALDATGTTNVTVEVQ